MDYCTTDSFSFVKELQQVSSKDKFLVSFDVTSLFTNIPLTETIELAINLIRANEPSVKLSRAQLRKMFLFATKQAHFLFNGDYYDQIDGVAMGSPLGPVLANLFMGVYEKKWLRRYKGPPVLFYKRYVDDIFCMFESKEHAHKFLEYLNKQHHSIKFTIEEETNGRLPFLDIAVSKLQSGSFHTTTYRKPTNTGLLTNFFSFCSYTYKTGLIKTLVDRAYKINSDPCSRETDLQIISSVLQKNEFPVKILKKVMTASAPNLIEENTGVNVQNQPDQVVQKRYFKLPYVGEFSSRASKVLSNLVSKYCTEEVDARFIFETYKVGRYFSLKDPIPKSLINHVVYFSPVQDVHPAMWAKLSVI